MTNLSPAAQAVLDAFGKHPLHSDHISDGLLYGALPDAIRAAADQVVPHEYLIGSDYEAACRQLTRLQLLAIADELEGVKYGTYRCDLELQ
jgi:hypothetical protein